MSHEPKTCNDQANPCDRSLIEGFERIAKSNVLIRAMKKVFYLMKLIEGTYMKKVTRYFLVFQVGPVFTAPG